MWAGRETTNENSHPLFQVERKQRQSRNAPKGAERRRVSFNTCEGCEMICEIG